MLALAGNRRGNAMKPVQDCSHAANKKEPEQRSSFHLA